MNRSTHLDQYKRTAVQTASPLQLVIMLYDGALRFIVLGRKAMLEGDLYHQNHYLQKAQRIISELTACLDMEKGADISSNLFGLYTFAYNELVAANVGDDPKPLYNAERVLEQLRSSWIELEKETRTQPVPQEERLSS